MSQYHPHNQEADIDMVGFGASRCLSKASRQLSSDGYYICLSAFVPLQQNGKEGRRSVY